MTTSCFCLPLSGRRRKFDPKANRSRQAVSSPGFLTASFNASASFNAQTERAGLGMCFTVREPTVGWETILEAGFGTDVVVLLVERELLVPSRFGLLE